MGSALKLRGDYSAGELRRFARMSKDVRQSSRLLSIGAILDGMSQADAARIGGMDRQTLCDWVHRFNAAGPEGRRVCRPSSKPTWPQSSKRGPDRAVEGVVRWRRVDLKCVTKDRFGVDYDTRYIGKLLHRLGFSHVSARPQHPAQDATHRRGIQKTARAR
ncbi:winged helix-turn-helix domain-containing protein [Mesorhizobium sp. M1E.F.Ca.ET.041.01.1.1]|uniref:helix-turn-helix domain-containing protein n=1 Tax=Mesorhizobium sp. M1E.F.Ca.ET.041.01.1.1 TaxID=2496759 RepID=UPI000FCACF31|nr:winged helix-turn-helix domain-containing protein [Mesorhizobium sp. M1E.F.Ca.ET.041.01.1.1]RUW23437.1 transposase [Mesorhizobium sp. M1E.F.Ca.ET.041.01.1.1]RWD81412.1 MAG: transposase [Mesorhizobium sp.]